jgi:hypothetical protein
MARTWPLYGDTTPTRTARFVSTDSACGRDVYN